MIDRTTLLSLTVASLLFAAPTARTHADVPAVNNVHLALFSDGGDKDKEDKKDDADDEKDEKHERREKHEEKEIEQAVPMNMVPQAILDAVKKEVPNGTITVAELEAKKGKIMYAFDVKDGEMKYDVKITVEGKFYSKKVDDEKDEKDEEKEKSEKKPAMKM